jgi:hypothetical protein
VLESPVPRQELVATSHGELGIAQQSCYVVEEVRPMEVLVAGKPIVQLVW